MIRQTEMEETDGISGAVDAAELPKGETILWRGSPEWRRLAWNAFRARDVSIWFALWAAWRAVDAAQTGQPGALIAALAPLMVAYGVAMLLIYGFAWINARSAHFTVTDRRLVMRYGVALPSQLNIPLEKVESAGLHLHRDGTGDIAMCLLGDQRPFYVQLWPFVRPWRLRNAQPTLRAIADAERVAGLLSDALAATGGQASAPQPKPTRSGKLGVNAGGEHGAQPKALPA